MIKIAIVEDDTSSARTLKEYIEQFFSSEKHNYSVDIFGDGLDFINNMKTEYDIVLLDIEMPILDGMETAKKLRKTGSSSNIIFVTNMSQYALKGYEVDAIGYLVKPIMYFGLRETLKRALSRMKLYKAENVNIMLTTKQDVTVIPSSTVYYIEVQNHDLIFHTEKGEIKSRRTLKEIEDQLEVMSFARCSNSYLVNLKYVESISINTIKINNTELPISRTKKKEFVQKFMSHTR